MDEDGLVTCIKPGTVAITATAKDGSGKSLNLAKLLEINPTDATYKIFDWKITGGGESAEFIVTINH